jgi:hypothetical protein
MRVRGERCLPRPYTRFGFSPHAIFSAIGASGNIIC